MQLYDVPSPTWKLVPRILGDVVLKSPDQLQVGNAGGDMVEDVVDAVNIGEGCVAVLSSVLGDRAAEE
jgi:hypothetical protein